MEYNITYRQKDGGWQYIISFKDEEGKWKQKAKQGFKTKAIAKKAADKRLEEMKKEFTSKKKLNKEYEGITLGEFKKMYLNNEELYKEYNTVLIYQNIFSHFSKLDDKPLDKITSVDIQEGINDMVKMGLASSTIEIYVSKLKTALNAAVKPYKIIAENPVSDITLPTDNKTNEIRVLSETELNIFLKEIRKHVNSQEYIITLLASTCGLRAGEIMGLTWNNVDFKNCQLTIDKQWKRRKKGMGFGIPKTKNSYRTIPIPSNTLLELEKYKKNNPTDINNRVIIYKSFNSLSQYLPTKYKKIGYDITLHELRHTYATTLIANGIDFKTVAKLMGHDVEQTIKTYSHFTDDMLKKATNAVNSIFK